MNRNFTAICATFLTLAILIAFLGGISINGNGAAFASSRSVYDTAVDSVDGGNDGRVTNKVIYLTFDDGPSDRVTPKILDVLKEEKVPATFFIIGKHAETRKYLLRREINEGHTVAVHSYSHVYKDIYSSPEKLIEDIDKCNEVIKGATGRPSAIYRFPGGSFGLSQRLINAVTERGLRYVDWNASTRDAEFTDPTPEQIVSASITTAANPERIVLLAHDSTTKTATAQALKGIIRHYKELNYTFASF